MRLTEAQIEAIRWAEALRPLLASEAVRDCDLPPRWIPRSERSPNATATMWVSCSEGVVLSDYVVRGMYGWFCRHGAMVDREVLDGDRLKGVTHWMPIHQPAPPEVA
jgi:hypothetical protein